MIQNWFKNFIFIETTLCLFKYGSSAPQSSTRTSMCCGKNLKRKFSMILLNDMKQESLAEIHWNAS